MELEKLILISKTHLQAQKSGLTSRIIFLTTKFIFLFKIDFWPNNQFWPQNNLSYPKKRIFTIKIHFWHQRRFLTPESIYPMGALLLYVFLLQNCFDLKIYFSPLKLSFGFKIIFGLQVSFSPQNWLLISFLNSEMDCYPKIHFLHQNWLWLEKFIFNFRINFWPKWISR